MRLFLPQNLERDEEATPPFLTDREEDFRFNLLRDTTQHVKEGKQRLPTPEKNAIMALSTSFEKRRLGKQQQILSEMTQRCRVQEVTDLSSKMSAKCDLKLHARGPNSHQSRDNPFYSSTTNTFRGNKHRLSDVNFEHNNSDPGTVSPSRQGRRDIEKAYKFFPARRIMRQPTKIHVISTNLPKVNSMAKHRHGRLPGEAFADAYRSPRYTDLGSPRQISHPSFNTPHCVPQSKADPLAPLQLPRLSLVDTNYQHRIDSYIASSRVATFPRSKTFLDTASTSGRSYKSLHTFHTTFDKNKNTNNLSNYNNENVINIVKGGGSNSVNPFDRTEFDIIPGISRLGDDEMNSLTSAGIGMGQGVDL